MDLTKQQIFKTYKDKVLYILQRYIDTIEEPKQELKWCLHVIKNDFLQISNSMLASSPSQRGTRRFSKT
jgi:hypothetical protein